MLNVLGPEEKSTIVSPLFALGTCSTLHSDDFVCSPCTCLATGQSCLSDVARHALHSLWNASSSTSKATLRFGDIVSALVTLGARREVAEYLHWAVGEDKCSLMITHEDRLRVVTGLVKLVEIAGR